MSDDFDELLRRWLRDRGRSDKALLERVAGHVAVLPPRRPSRWSGLARAAVILLAVGLAAAVLIRPSLPAGAEGVGVAGPSASASPAGSGGPVGACRDGEWPRTAITCEAAYRVGSQAGARVERARIWLTTLAAVREAYRPPTVVVEPSPATAVWLIVYDGRWRCCPNAFDERGALIPQEVRSRWLVTVDATQEGTGFIHIANVSDHEVVDAMPPPDHLTVRTPPGPSASPASAGPLAPLPPDVEPTFLEYPGFPWRDSLGAEVSRDIAQVIKGSAHCGWENVAFVSLGWPIGVPGYDIEHKRHYVRDPNEAVDPDGIYHFQAEYDGDAELPADAADTGYRYADAELWISPSDVDDAIYFVRPDVVERLPRDPDWQLLCR